MGIKCIHVSLLTADTRFVREKKKRAHELDENIYKQTVWNCSLFQLITVHHKVKI